jgi:hypothetical protein
VTGGQWSGTRPEGGDQKTEGRDRIKSPALVGVRVFDIKPFGYRRSVEFHVGTD